MPLCEKCGGCQFIDMPYEKQLERKQKELKALLGKFARVSPIIGMEDPLHYRHKVHAVMGYERESRLRAYIRKITQTGTC